MMFLSNLASWHLRIVYKIISPSILSSKQPCELGRSEREWLAQEDPVRWVTEGLIRTWTSLIQHSSHCTTLALMSLSVRAIRQRGAELTSEKRNQPYIGPSCLVWSTLIGCRVSGKKSLLPRHTHWSCKRLNLGTFCMQSTTTKIPPKIKVLHQGTCSNCVVGQWNNSDNSSKYATPGVNKWSRVRMLS